jgi:uncharacterized membrane protein
MKHLWMVWMMCGILFDATGNVLIKKGYCLIGAIVYAATIPFWVLALQLKDLSSLAIIASIISVSLAVLAGHIFCNESLSQTQMVGFLLGILSLALLG